MTQSEPDPRPRRVLVTGGAGFIGSHVVDRYLMEGCEVTVLDDLSSGQRERVSPEAGLVEGGLDDSSLDRLFSDSRFDLVNHHAAQIDVRKSVADPVGDAATNVTGLLRLLERARRHGVRRFVYVSSGGVVYGEPSVIPVPESHPTAPLSPYGVSKLAGELYVNYYGVVHGLETVALRYSNVYGPRQSPHGEAGVVAIFCQAILGGGPITIFGDGTQERDYVYVGDVADANWAVSGGGLPSTDGPAARAWNIGTGRGTSVNELAGLLMHLAGREVDRRTEPARTGELRRSVLDPDRAARELGWRARTTLEDGLMRTLEHLRQTSSGPDRR